MIIQAKEKIGHYGFKAILELALTWEDSESVIIHFNRKKYVDRIINLQ